MAIENEVVARFVKEDMRPMAETLRSLKAAIDSRVSKWFGGVSAVAVNDAKQSIEEYRDDKGVAPLDGAKLNSLMGVLLNIKTVLDAPGVNDVIEAACVRSKDIR